VSVRRVALLLLLYVTMDFSNPHMPGALTFDAQDSVEGVHAERGRSGPPVATVPPAPRPAAPLADSRSSFARRVPPGAGQPRRWRAGHAGRTPVLASPAGGSEDH
jgi:hypothetical protein